MNAVENFPKKKNNLEEILKTGFKNWGTKAGYAFTIAATYQTLHFYHIKNYEDAILGTVIPLTLLTLTLFHQYTMGKKYLKNKG